MIFSSVGIWIQQQHMGVGRGAEGPCLPRILKISAIKVVFLVSSGKKQISPLLVPSGKILGNSPGGPPGKNPSDAHAATLNDSANFRITGQN